MIQAAKTGTVAYSLILNPQGGFIGIATTTPNNKLDIYSATKAAIGFDSNAGASNWTIGQDASDSYKFKISSSTALGTNDRFVIDGNGNVGIGTTSPTGTFTVYSTNQGSVIPQVWVDSNGNNALIALNNSQSGGRRFDVTSTGGSATVASSFNVVDRTGAVARLVINSGGDFGVGNITNNSLAGANLVALNGGNVGIGNTSPNRLLTVGTPGGTGSSVMSVSGGSSGTGAGAAIITEEVNGVPLIGLGNASSLLGGAFSNDLVLYNASSTADRFYTNAAERMRIDSSGNVGIGTTSPATTLSVAGNGYLTGGLGIGALNTTAGTLQTSAGATINGLLTVGTAAAGSITATGDATFQRTAGSSETLTLATNGAASHSILSFSNTGASGHTVDLDFGGNTTAVPNSFSIIDVTASNATRFLIDPNGNVGIGTTSPDNILSVAGSSNPAFHISNTAGAVDGWISRYSNRLQVNASDLLAFGAGNQTNEQMVLTSAGNLGIATTTPSFNLDVFQGATGIANNAGIMVEGSNETGIRLRNYSYNTFDIFSGGGGNSVFNNKLTFFDRTNNLSRMVIDNSGLVGIGTTSPLTNLTVSSSLATPVNIDSTNAGGSFLQFLNGDVSKGYVGYSPSGSKGMSFLASNGSTVNMLMTDGGNLGIGTTSPPYKLTVDNAANAGIVAGFENSSGECTINPTSSSVNCSSDITLKKNITPIASSTDALASVENLTPVFFNWSAEATGTPQHSGFIAQSVLPIFPDLVSTGSNGKLLLNYAGFVPYLTGAIQEMANISGTFRDNLIAWLGNAGNGIADLFAKNVYADSLKSRLDTTQQLCLADGPNDPAPICVTKPQLAALLRAAASAASPASVTSSTSSGGVGNSPSTSPESVTSSRGAGNTSTVQNPSPSNPASVTSTPSAPAPQLSITGNNPATITVGATYNDLGATITGPAADLNLSIAASVDGGATTTPDQIQIDTTAPGTHTIVYCATDQQGLSACATRTVIVKGQTLVTVPPLSKPTDASTTNTNIANTGAEDTASTTTATTP